MDQGIRSDGNTGKGPFDQEARKAASEVRMDLRHSGCGDKKSEERAGTYKVFVQKEIASYEKLSRSNWRSCRVRGQAGSGWEEVWVLLPGQWAADDYTKQS